MDQQAIAERLAVERIAARAMEFEEATIEYIGGPGGYKAEVRLYEPESREFKDLRFAARTLADLFDKILKASGEK